MSDTPLIHYWMGRPPTDLTRDELIQALIETNCMVAVEREMPMQSLDVLSAARKHPANSRDTG